MPLRACLAIVAALVVATLTTPARAWQEAHESGDDLRVRIEPNGTATVHDLVRWRVVRGPVKSIDLVNVDATAVLDPDVTITPEDGHPLSGHLVRADERTVRVLVDQPRALMRGTFTFEASWHIDLMATHALSFDGANWRLKWSAPIASDGIDTSRTVFDLLGASAEPRPIFADTGAVDESAVATIQHDGGRDLLELVRPHVARGESASWVIRIDPHALAGVTDPTLRAATAPPPPEADRVHAVAWVLALVALAGGFGLLASQKSAAYAELCAPQRARVRGLLPLPTTWRTAVGSAAFAGAAAMQFSGRPHEGALLAAVAAVAAALRAPTQAGAPRGPGRWLALRPEEAFANGSSPRHWMDIDAPAGRVALALAGVLTFALAAIARRFDPEAPWFIALDSAALLPLFVTGRAAQLPPSDRSAAPWLKRVFDGLRGIAALRAVPWGRVTLDGSRVDELRILALPRAAMPGVAGIEVGLAWDGTPVGWSGSPEVLVRVLDGSPAAARLAQAGPLGRVLPGRRPDERVLRAVPRRRTPVGAASLVAAFAEVMTDRRSAEAEAGAWTAPERRRAETQRRADAATRTHAAA
jgi:hypothetical protein